MAKVRFAFLLAVVCSYIFPPLRDKMFARLEAIEEKAIKAELAAYRNNT